MTLVRARSSRCQRPEPERPINEFRQSPVPPRRSPSRYAQAERLGYYRGVLTEPGDGELLVKVLYISLDPAMRGWMNEGRSYIPAVEIGAVMRALAVGRVIASKNPKYAVGDHVSGSLGVQEYALSNGDGLNKIDTRIAPLPVWLSVFGATGMTAYFGLLEVGSAEGR